MGKIKNLVGCVFVLFVFLILGCEKDDFGREFQNTQKNSQLRGDNGTILSTEAKDEMERNPNLQLIYQQFEGVLQGTTGELILRNFGYPGWEMSIITNSEYLIVEPENTFGQGALQNQQSTQQIILPFIGDDGIVKSLLINEFDLNRNETRQKFIHRNAYNRLINIVPGEQKFERTATFAFELYDNGGDPTATTAGFGCCPPCWQHAEFGCVRLAGGDFIPCDIDCGDEGNGGSGSGTNDGDGPTIVINGGNVPGWYADTYISTLDWVNRPQGQGGTSTAILDLDHLLGGYHLTGGTGVYQNGEYNINCLTDAFLPNPDDPTNTSGGGLNGGTNQDLGILGLLTDLFGQSDEVFNQIMNINSFFSLGREQGQYLIFHQEEASIIEESLENGSVSPEDVNAYLNFKLAFDPCNSVLHRLDFNLLKNNTELFTASASYISQNTQDEGAVLKVSRILFLKDCLGLENETLIWLINRNDNLDNQIVNSVNNRGCGDSEFNKSLKAFLRIKQEDDEYKFERFEELFDLLEENPEALVENCQDILGIEYWSDLASFAIPESCKNRLDQLGWENQDILAGNSATVNLDKHSVSISLLPDVNGDGIRSTNELFNFIRTYFPMLASGGTTVVLNNVPDYDVNWNWDFFQTDENLWISSDPVTTIVNIDVSPDNFWDSYGITDDGTVICSSFTNECCWVFSTVSTDQFTFPSDGSHPVSGNRQFGITLSADGYEFYTQAADRGKLSKILGPLAFFTRNDMAEVFYAITDATWDNLTRNITNFINNAGGIATQNTPITIRPNWNEVMNLLRADAPITSIPCE